MGFGNPIKSADITSARDNAELAADRLEPGVAPASSAVGATGVAQSGIDTLLSRVTSARAAELDGIRSVDLATLLARLTAARATALDSIGLKNYRVKSDATTGLQVLPDLANPINMNTGPTTAWNPGPWTEFTSGLAFDVMIIGTQLIFVQVSRQAQLDIALGAGGSEVRVASTTARMEATVIGHVAVPLPVPIEVPAGTRIACRVSSSTAASHVYAGYLQVVRTSDLEAF